MTETTNPLQTIIDEFKALSPETTNALIFKNTGELAANTQATSEDKAKEFITRFEGLTLQAGAIGGLQNLTIQGTDRQLNITAIDNFYLATVSSRAANPDVTQSLTGVIVPTVIRLLNQVDSEVPDAEQTPEIEPKEKQPEICEPAPSQEQATNAPQPTFEPLPPKTPINQFMVEKIGGLLVAADTVRIDPEVIAQWSELYGGKQILAVAIEALDGKKTTCKIKPIKESKSNIKGIVQVPEKILQNLKAEKGKLVMVKPVVE